MNDTEIHEHNKQVYEEFVSCVVNAAHSNGSGKTFVNTLRSLLNHFRKENRIGIWSVVEKGEAVSVQVQAYGDIIIYRRVVVPVSVNWKKEGF